MSVADEVALLEFKDDEDVVDGLVVEPTEKSHVTGFGDFFLRPELIHALKDVGFEVPSEVQRSAIPHAITGADVLCQSKSGMGKTAIFVLSVLHQLNVAEIGNELRCLVIAHTRELAIQLLNEFERFKTYIDGLRCAVVYGGVPLGPQVEMFASPEKCPHVLVSTAGRIWTLSKDGSVDLSHVSIFVVDECDKCLSHPRMRQHMQEVFMRTPHNKQVMMFSATMDKEMRSLCLSYMQSPVEVIVDSECKLTLHGLVQHYVKLDENEKTKKLIELLEKLDYNQVVVFVGSVQRAHVLKDLLAATQLPVVCIHGGMSQPDRIAAYQKFKAFEYRIIVATDILARGIDVERINIVINYDMAESADVFLHRVGRAGRFGTKGLTITFISKPEDEEVLNSVQSRFETVITELPDSIDSSVYINQ